MLCGSSPQCGRLDLRSSSARLIRVPVVVERVWTELCSGGYSSGCLKSIEKNSVYSDSTVDYLKMFLLNVPAALISLVLVFFLDDLTGFEITYLLELPEPYSFVFTWFVVLPITFFIAQFLTNAILKDFIILKGPCPNCGTFNNSFFGTILTIPSGGDSNMVKCEKCNSMLKFELNSRLITLENTATDKAKAPKKVASSASVN
ncbi:hypothetical protein L7F22_030230 [Adiantum nelumboides]|nr:hypothetical protein [Adiantum nelumboides]